MGPAVTTGPAVVGSLTVRRLAPGWARSTYAMKHVGHTGRPVGGSGAVPSSIARCLRRRRRHAAHERARRRDPVRRRASEGCRAGRRRSDRGAARRVGVRPARDARLVGEGCAPAARPLIDSWRKADVKEGYESKVDAIVSACRAALPDEGQFAPARHRRPAVGTMIVAPSLADIDRCPSRSWRRSHRRSADVLRQRPLGARRVDAASTATTSSASRRSTRRTAFAVVGRLARTRALAERLATLVER